MLFTELMPLIKQRPITITAALHGDTHLRINVIPQRLDKDKAANDKIPHAHRKEVAEIPATALAALTTPLSITGTPEELDAELPSALTQFVSQHATLQKSVDTATEEICAAVKSIDEREKNKKAQDKKDKDKNGKGEDKTASSGSKAEKKTTTEEPALPSLFLAAQPAASASEKPSEKPEIGNPPNDSSSENAKGGE